MTDATTTTRQRREERRTNAYAPPATPPSQLGRPTAWTPERAQVLESALLVREDKNLDLTDAELCEIFGISTRSLYNFLRRNPHLRHLTHLAAGVATERVVRALYERAVGYTREEEQIHVVKHRDSKNRMRHKVVRVKTSKHYAPDVNAIQFWLKNRAKAEWRDQWFIQDERTRSPIDGLGTVAVLDRIEQLRAEIIKRQDEAQRGITIEGTNETPNETPDQA